MQKQRTGWAFLVCVALFAGACSDDATLEEQESEATADAEQKAALPVREWYPTPKHAPPRIVITPSRPEARQQPLQQQPYSSVPAQQQWQTLPPAYTAPQPAQPQTPWGGTVYQWPSPVQQPGMPQQYQYTYPYQYEQRPWGSVPPTAERRQPDTSQYSWPQGGNGYWGTPMYGGGQYYVYPAPGMPGYAW